MTPDFTSIVLKYGHVALQQAISRHELLLARGQVEITACMNRLVDGMIVTLSASLAAGDQQTVCTETVSYPADWTQHFKRRWFTRSRLGRWLLGKYPIRMTAVKIDVKHITRMCPHLPLPPSGGIIRNHLEWCVQKDPHEGKR